MHWNLKSFVSYSVIVAVKIYHVNGVIIAMSIAIHSYLIEQIDREHDNQAMIRT